LIKWVLEEANEGVRQEHMSATQSTATIQLVQPWLKHWLRESRVKISCVNPTSKSWRRAHNTTIEASVTREVTM
jgi:hypothetical protein